MQVKGFNWIMPLGFYDYLALHFSLLCSLFFQANNALRMCFSFGIMSQLQNDLVTDHRLNHLWFLVLEKKEECTLDFEMTKDRLFHCHLKWQGRRMQCWDSWKKVAVLEPE